VIAIFCGRLRRGERPTVYGDGTQTRDYIFVGDIAEAIIAAGASEATGAINLGTEEETTVLHIVETLGRFDPAADFTPDLQPARLGELDRSCLDAGRARELLGWSARIRIDEGLRLTYESTVPAT
jgi:UDP-glucose 4-epimerase